MEATAANTNAAADAGEGGGRCITIALTDYCSGKWAASKVDYQNVSITKKKKKKKKERTENKVVAVMVPHKSVNE